MNSYNSKNISKDIPPTMSGKRFVIGDIHGCLNTLKKLINKIGLEKRDQLFFLGDYIDRGPNSKGVLDYIFDLINNGYNVYPLCGNHEADLLEYMNEEPHILLWHMKKGNYENMMEGDTVAQKYVKFIKSLPYYYDTGDYYVVHAGFNFTKKEPFKEVGDMLCLRRKEYDQNNLNGHRLIHGHQPVYIEEIKNKVKNREIVLPLDNGVPYVKKHKVYDHTRLGSLCCLNLDSYDLFVQKNIDMI